ncbi:hypothetical protein GA0115260_115983, partial [Streptomyces sp. MnatMP-M27]
RGGEQTPPRPYTYRFGYTYRFNSRRASDR